MERIIKLEGSIGSENAQEVEEKIRSQLSSTNDKVTLDAENLNYISSSGLRVVLKIKKDYPHTQIINCSQNIYDIFSITGFTDMIDVYKKLREISLEGCEKIGTGFYGDVYRFDSDTIVKLYKYPDSLEMIKREQRLAKKAFVMGIPTAIPYDIVKIGDNYGALFERLNAKPVINLIEDDEAIKDFCDRCVKFLKHMHSLKLNPGDLPNRKEQFFVQIEGCKDYFTAEEYEKLYNMAEDIPDMDTMIHSDFHIKNIMMQDDELLIIDMDTLSQGHTVFEFGAMYATYVGFGCINHNNTMEFLGIPEDKCKMIWDNIFRGYFEDKSEEDLRKILKKIEVISYMEILYLRMKYGDHNDEITNKEIEFCVNFIKQAVNEIYSLYY